MTKELKEMICDTFADCLTVEDVALTYAEIYLFIRTQMYYSMECLTEVMKNDSKRNV